MTNGERFTGRRVTLAALLLVLVIAAGLRGWHLRQPYVDAFSWRQASTAMIAENYFRTDANILWPEVNWSGPGPNYQGREFQTVTWLAALGYRVVGVHDWVGRGVAAAFGVWGVAALFLLVRRLRGDGEGLAAAAALATMPGAIFVDRSFLPDPAMVALATTTLWLFVRWLQEGGWRLLLATGVVGGWGFATKVPGLIVGLPMAYAAVALVGWREILRPVRLLQLAAITALILLPVAAWYSWARHLALSYPPYHFAGEGNWVWDVGLARWLADGYFADRLRRHFMGWIWTPAFASLVALGLLTPLLPSRFRSASEGEATTVHALRHPAPYLFHGWMVALAVFYAIGARELVDNPWNFHVAAPAAAALAGSGAVWLGGALAALVDRGGGSRIRIGAACTAVVLCAVLMSSRRHASFMYTDYAWQDHALGVALDSITSRGALVLTMASALGDPTPIYYARRRGWVFPPARDGKSWGQLPSDDAESIALLDELRGSGARWLGITTEQRRRLDAHPALMAHVAQVSETTMVHRAYVIHRLRPPVTGGR